MNVQSWWVVPVVVGVMMLRNTQNQSALFVFFHTFFFNRIFNLNLFHFTVSCHSQSDFFFILGLELSLLSLFN